MLATMLCDSESWTRFYVWESDFGDINNRLDHGEELTGHYVQPPAAPSLPEVVWMEKVYGVNSLAAGKAIKSVMKQSRT